MQHIIDRFISYITIDTESDPNSETTPSTAKQWDLAHILVEELKAIGLSDVTIDDNAYIMATLPSNVDHEVPTIGFISHFDTSPDFTGANIKPQIVENYDGKDIILNAEQDIVLSPDYFEDLLMYKGQTLITTDGTTLLGADDKAGITEIVTAMEYLINHLPRLETPEHTEGYEGFFHLHNMEGEVEETTLQYIIRDHDKDKFEARKALMQKIVDDLNAKYESEVFKLELKDQYFNMKEKVEPVMHIVDIAEEAMKAVGVTPLIKAIRGGTDGSQLSYMGLPCPNIFAGGHNFHGRYEYVPVESIQKAVEVIVKIAELTAIKK